MKRIWRIGLVAAGLCALPLLAGCPATIENPLSPSVAYGVTAAYGAAQGAGIAYAALPRCTAGAPNVACSKASVVAQLTNYDKKARAALTALDNFVQNPQNYPGLTYAGLYSAAMKAISDYKSYISNAKGN